MRECVWAFVRACVQARGLPCGCACGACGRAHRQAYGRARAQACVRAYGHASARRPSFQYTVLMLKNGLKETKRPYCRNRALSFWPRASVRQPPHACVFIRTHVRAHVCAHLRTHATSAPTSARASVRPRVLPYARTRVHPYVRAHVRPRPYAAHAPALRRSKTWRPCGSLIRVTMS